ncbi:hypothetical protein LCGC14_0226320 [marine sediment metagenome]|uniref:ATPase AAA-type core domain-containing protein n=1 Tax=marine sediment metagenome TaxID=412755 RepID=A0A0F9UG90_9ZZZZ
MKLTGIGFGKFRSIGKDLVWLDLTKKVNVLIGANNSGKSNVLRALALITKRRGLGGYEIGEVDRHLRDAKNAFLLGFRFQTDEEDGRLETGIRLEFVWSFEGATRNDLRTNLGELRWPVIQELQRRTKGSSYQGQPSEAQRKEIFDNIGEKLCHKSITRSLPVAATVLPFRQITAQGDHNLQGAALIPLLRNWQVPNIGDDNDRAKFEAVGDLLKKLLHMPDVRLEVPKVDRIIVARGDLRLPLESYGTGVHELIILAVAVLSQDKTIFCIEEPEIHLHPLLQKEFLDFLITQTTNTYVLSTHSNALMGPSDDVSVTHVWTEDGVTKGRQVLTTSHGLQALRDLGVRPSDLLQANSVVWVEGPSDRIYLNRWLSLLAPELREGIDYSIMFYGGKLLSHLTLERDQSPPDDVDEGPDCEDLIELLRINQHSGVIIDSDKDNETDDVNETKKRISSECEANSIPCWITRGREIENYVSPASIVRTYAQITEQGEQQLEFGDFDRLQEVLEAAYGDAWEPKWSYALHKPDRARQIVGNTEKPDISPKLKQDIAPIIEMIRAANG